MSWGGQAFIRGQPATDAWGLDPRMAKTGRCFPNVNWSASTMIIELEVRTVPRLGMRSFNKKCRSLVKCAVCLGGRMPISESTDWPTMDGSTSLFRGAVAQELGIELPSGDQGTSVDTVRLPGGERFDFYYCEHELFFSLGSHPILVPVRFPVDVLSFGAGMTPVKCRWRRDFPSQNVLLPRGVLDQVMLCFTPECMFVFDRPE